MRLCTFCHPTVKTPSHAGPLGSVETCTLPSTSTSAPRARSHSALPYSSSRRAMVQPPQGHDARPLVELHYLVHFPTQHSRRGQPIGAKGPCPPVAHRPYCWSEQAAHTAGTGTGTPLKTTPAIAEQTYVQPDPTDGALTARPFGSHRSRIYPARLDRCRVARHCHPGLCCCPHHTAPPGTTPLAPPLGAQSVDAHPDALHLPVPDRLRPDTTPAAQRELLDASSARARASHGLLYEDIEYNPPIPPPSDFVRPQPTSFTNLAVTRHRLQPV